MSKSNTSAKRYTLGEELLNSISHGAGALLAVAGTVVMLVFAVMYSDVWGITAAAIYGFTLTLLYTMSTLYHAITNESAKKVFRILDHSTIFLLIAGTYTPYALVTMHGTTGWIILSLVWGSAVIGIVLNSISIERFKKISMILYIASGWATILGIKPMVENLPTAGLVLLFLGGLFYMVGIIFYSMKKHKYFHGIWHFFVLGGSISHYFSILLYVLR